MRVQADKTSWGGQLFFVVVEIAECFSKLILVASVELVGLVEELAGLVDLLTGLVDLLTGLVVELTGFVEYFVEPAVVVDNLLLIVVA